MKDSRVVQWYNDVVDPTFLGCGNRFYSSISPLLDQCFESLPVNLDSLLALLPYDADEFLESNIIDRLVLTLLNEEDERIADFWTKQQVMDIFFLLLQTSRRAKVRFRICLQLITTWIDDIIPEKEPTEDQRKELQVLVNLMKQFYALIWNIHPRFSEQYLNNSSYSLETTKCAIIQQYTAVQIQAIIRSFIQRRRLQKYLQSQKDGQRQEIQQWSILTLQKVARGYIARKKIIPELKIRHQLSKEVLRITENFLTKHHNLWQFLKEINEEMVYYQKELTMSIQREDNWAQTFVERVIQQRESEFQNVWDDFPKAMNTILTNKKKEIKKERLKPGEMLEEGAETKGLADHSSIGNLFPDEKVNLKDRRTNDTSTGGSLLADTILYEKSNLLGETLPTTAFGSPLKGVQPLPSLHSPSPAISSTNISKSNNSVTKSNKSKKRGGKYEITEDDVTIALLKTQQQTQQQPQQQQHPSSFSSSSAFNQSMSTMGNHTLVSQPVGSSIDAQEMIEEMEHETKEASMVPREMGGPIIRKALQRTVTKEVTKQLNELMNESFRSRKLSQEIRSVYEPESHYEPLKTKPRSLLGNTKKSSQKTKMSQSLPALSSSSGNTFSGIPVNTTMMKEKQAEMKKQAKGGLDGTVSKQVGTVTVANTTDWVSSNAQNTLSTRVGSSSSSKRYHTMSGTEEATNEEEKERDLSVMHDKVQPGITILLDIPNGLDDTIERLLHAAALRCYVPPFFRGPGHSSNSTQEKKSSSSSLDHLTEEELNTLDSLPSSSTKTNNAKQHNTIHSDPQYAYEMYLALPLGLAKMKYEMECKTYAQGYINQLRIKGVAFIQDAFPLSKLVMCLKSVHTPMTLINKCVELFVELKNMKTFSLKEILLQEQQQQKEQQQQLSQSSSSKKRLLKTSSTTVSENTTTADHRTDLTNMDPIAELRPLSDGTLPKTENTSVVGKTGIDKHSSPEERVTIQASEMLQRILEECDTADWCSLSCNLEEFFIQAAFLIIPHKSSSFSSSSSSSSSSSLLSNKQSPSILQQHTNNVTSSSSARKIQDGVIIAEESEEDLGNHCFKRYAQALLSVTNEDNGKRSIEEQKTALIQQRFRACMIYITPYVLYLKQHQITTVRDLLTIDLLDLSLPKALTIQLEILVNIVIAKRVLQPSAKLLPIPRNHLDMHPKHFTVPMFYDARYQLNPLDITGKSIHLSSGKFVQDMVGHSSNNSVSSSTTGTTGTGGGMDTGSTVSTVGSKKPNSHTGVVGRGTIIPVKLKSLDKQSQAYEAAMHRYDVIDTTSRYVQDIIGQDLPTGPDMPSGVGGPPQHVGISLWTTSGGGSSTGGGPGNAPGDSMSSLVAGEKKYEQNKWSFVRQPPGQSSSSGMSGGNSTMDLLDEHSAMTTSITAGTTNGTGTANGTTGKKKKVKHTVPTTTANTTTATANTTAAAVASMMMTTTTNYIQMNKESSTLRPRDVFKGNYACPYPHCHQLFSRQYTYQIHIKSHETFPQYHQYKRLPQLHVDQLPSLSSSSGAAVGAAGGGPLLGQLTSTSTMPLPTISTSNATNTSHSNTMQRMESIYEIGGVDGSGRGAGAGGNEWVMHEEEEDVYTYTSSQLHV